MNQTITATGVFDETQLSRGRYWHWMKVPWIAWIFPIIGILITFGAVHILLRSEHLQFAPWILLLMGLYFIFRYWIFGFHFRRELKKNPHYGKQMTWTFSEKGIETVAEGFEFKTEWNGFHETYITPDGFLLYPQKAIFF